MRKIIFTFLMMILFAMPACAVEYMPKYNNSVKNYGIGIYFGEGNATIFKEPNDKSHVLAKMKWDSDKVYINDKVTEPKNVFVVFLPDNALSGFIATDEQNNEYTEVIYDMSKNLKGWIKNSPETKAFYWRQLFYKYGKTKGLYLFSNIPNESKILRLSPELDGEISYTFVYPTYIRLQLIKGNWALIKVVDYDNEQKVGWFKWRNSDGSLNMFPNFKG